MSVYYQLDFEKPIVELDEQIEALEQRLAGIAAVPPTGSLTGSAAAPPPAVDQLRSDVETLRATREKKLAEIYANLNPWQIVRVARHPLRPQTRDYIKLMCREFVELHGDRRFGDDPAIVVGFARLGPSPGQKVLLVGHQKGKETSEKIACNFGCAHPEGYRKAMAKMELAAKYRLPIVTLVDTPGAYPGLGAEQRGQAEAIAVNMREMSQLPTPIVSVVIGEGGSGGALGIAVADRVAMLAHSWYSVISPEGCAAILWKEANERTNTAAAIQLKLSARDNLDLGIIDEAIPEPVGGAHRNPAGAADQLQRWILSNLAHLKDLPTETLLEQRYERFRRMGSFAESAS